MTEKTPKNARKRPAAAKSSPRKANSPPPAGKPRGKPEKAIKRVAAKKTKKTPKAFDPQIAREICLALAEGIPLRHVCKKPGIPDRKIIYGWIEDNPAFAAAYARARRHCAHDAFDDIAEIERGVMAGEIDPTAARVVIDSRKWRLAKMCSRWYGDRAFESDSAAAAVPVKTYVVRECSPDIWDADIAAEKAAGGAVGAAESGDDPVAEIPAGGGD